VTSISDFLPVLLFGILNDEKEVWIHLKNFKGTHFMANSGEIQVGEI